MEAGREDTRAREYTGMGVGALEPKSISVGVLAIAGARLTVAQLALTVCSAWQWFCSTRTFSNCLETTLTIIALESWPWQWSLGPKREATQAEGLRTEPAQEEGEQHEPTLSVYENALRENNC